MRSQLIAALANEAMRYDVQWLPGYYPVEGRVRLVGEPGFPAFVPVKAVQAEEAGLLAVEVEAEKASLVAGLLVLPSTGADGSS
jgi:hypothetical protein